MIPRKPLLVVALLPIAALTPRAAPAQGQPPGTVSGSAAVTAFHQFLGDLEGGGDVAWSSLTLHAGVTRQLVPAVAAGVALRYDVEEWRLGSGGALGPRAPWGRLQRPGASVTLSLALSRTLLVALSPGVEWAFDRGAGAADAFTYGAVASAAKAWTSRFTLGAGASAYRQFYSVKVSPFVIVNWRLTDRLRVANAPGTSPEGGAGVELRYALTPDWELAAGGVYRSDRFRLAARGTGPGGVGEPGSIPLLARVSRRLGARSRLDLYAGALTRGRLTLKDADGHELARPEYGAAPAVALTLARRF